MNSEITSENVFLDKIDYEDLNRDYIQSLFNSIETGKKIYI